MRMHAFHTRMHAMHTLHEGTQKDASEHMRTYARAHTHARTRALVSGHITNDHESECAVLDLLFDL